MFSMLQCSGHRKHRSGCHKQDTVAGSWCGRARDILTRATVWKVFYANAVPRVMNSVIFPSSESFNGKDTWISWKSPHRGIKNNVLFIYEADFVLCADFIISLSLVSQRRTNSWFLTRCFHRGFVLFFPGNYQSICTGKNQTMLPYFWFLTRAE